MASEKIVTESALAALASDAKRAIYDVLPGGSATGNPCTFDTDIAVPLKSLIANIVASQDLHGYDRPWPAGGGKNKLPPCSISGDSSLTITSDNGKYTLSGTATGYNQYIASNTFFLKEGTYTLKNFGNTDVEVHFQIRSVDGTITYADSILNPSTFTLSEDTELRTRITVNHSGTYTYSEVLTPQIELGSTATAYEPYSNICPIVGHSELNLTRCGVNVWDEEWEVGGLNAITGEAEPNNTRIRSTGFCPCVPSTAYYGYIGTASVSLLIYWYDSNNDFIMRNDITNNTVTSPINARFFKVMTYDKLTPHYTDYQNDISILYPSDTTPAYHAYNGHTFTVAFGQTVYGGVLDVTRGKLHVTHEIIDLGSLSWNYSSGTYSRFYSSGIANLVKAPETADTIPNMVASSYEVTSFRVAYQQQTNNVIAITEASSGSHGNINVVDNNYSDAVVFKTAVAGQTLAYELATPFDIDLTPEVILAIVGTNNVFADCGETEVEYYTDLAGDIKDFIGDDVEVGDLADVKITTPSEGDTLVYDSANSKWVNGQGGGKQTALTQAEYDALVQAGTVDPTMEYFITDGIPSTFTPTISVYSGTKTSVLTDGECKITIVDMGSGKIIQISGYFKANGVISTVTEYTDLFIFDAEAVADISTLSDSVILCFGQDKGFFFTRVACHSATNAIASFWGTNADKWYSFNQTFIIKK